jgi:cyclophilin family peptidyl-prolyl cis-trans isomerase/HEAT repeat protein
MVRRTSLVLIGVAMSLTILSCKSAPVVVQTPAPPPPPQARPDVPLDRKVGWILRLEQQRVLRDADVTRGETPAQGVRMLAPAATADLEALALDSDPAVRARAVMAIGRIDAREGIPALLSALTDSDELVRANAAFGLGNTAATEGVAPLIALLKDSSPFVHGRAAEALGLIGQASAAGPIADAAADCRRLLAGIDPDDETYPKTPEIEACRVSLYALVRLKQYDAIARVALNDQGQPVSHWWPVAFALQRSADKRASSALLALASGQGIYTRSFALRGLAGLGDRQALPLALTAANDAKTDIRLRATAIRALGQVGGVDAVQPLLKLLADSDLSPGLALEVVTALGAIADPRAFDPLVNRWTDPWPAMRSASLAASAKVNPEGFVLLVSSLDRDKDWSVRAALAGALAGLPADTVRSALQDLTEDEDMRVRGPALTALAHIDSPDLTKRLFDALEAPDFAVRATAAGLVGEKKPADGVARLTTAYTRSAGDATYTARVAILQALAKYNTEPAKVVIRRGLSDPEWPVRLSAAELLRGLGETTAAPVRPAPLRQPATFFESDVLLHPRYSPHAILDTRYGAIELELDVVDAPVTTQAFVELARAGFFNGIKAHRVIPNFVVQGGDPRGDGEGGPGYSLRDEFSPQPYLRGTVGMALDGRDTGGSQFFIALSPQPHLDGKYTVFGHVVKGAEILDRIAPWDVIDRVRILDGSQDTAVRTGDRE